MKLTRWPNYHEGRGRDYTKAVMSPLSVSTSSDVCKHLSALLIAIFYSQSRAFIFLLCKE